MPLLRNPDKSKLSKRRNPTGIGYYERMGFLPEAVVNYLGRMGWSMPDEREKFSLKDMIGAFDLDRVSLGGPVFDQDKLKWLNGLWIRESLTLDELGRRFHQWAINNDYLKPLLPQVQPRIEVLSDAVPLAGFMLAGMLPLKADDFAHKSLDTDAIRRILQFSLWTLEAERCWEQERIVQRLVALSGALEIKMRDFMTPLFVAISGRQSAPSIMEAMAHLGPDMTRARLRHALSLLGDPSKKEQKRWEKEFAAFGALLMPSSGEQAQG
jgi:glutamyl-tRNA synthetase